jgi:hypothetical protein
MSFKIKSIDTEYNGYKFRSRLEARWAVFFDEIGVEYAYEPQGWVLSTGVAYMPDFYLPKLKAYVEVKFQKLGIEDYLKAKNLCKETGERILILDGDPSHRRFCSFIKDDNYEKGIRITEFNLILNDNKDDFRTDLEFIIRDQYELRGFQEELEAIDKARGHRFGVYE